MVELKETSQIRTEHDVAERLYHAFEVFRYLPAVRPQGYFNIFWLMKPEQLTSDDIRPVVCSFDYNLALEVCDVWWPWLLRLSDMELLELIKYRCGAPIIKAGKEVYGWSRIRPWKAVAAEFHCHRNTAQKKWRSALLYILKKSKGGSL